MHLVQKLHLSMFVLFLTLNIADEKGKMLTEEQRTTFLLRI